MYTISYKEVIAFLYGLVLLKEPSSSEEKNMNNSAIITNHPQNLKHLQIEISGDDLQQLLTQRAISASQIKCLNKRSKLCMWALLLKSCFG